MKVSISKNEWWPVYVLDSEPYYYNNVSDVPKHIIDKYDSLIDAPDSFVVEYQLVMTQFKIMQDKLRDLFQTNLD